MQKTVIKYGLIGGALVVGFMFATMPFLLSDKNFDNGEIVGYATMLVALSSIYFGIRSYRDKDLEGQISFKQAFTLGLYICLVASALYVIGWLIFSSTLAPDFMAEYQAHMLESMREQGMTTAEIADKEIEMNEFAELYKNPLIKIGITFLEIFPVGLIISLVSALLLRSPKAQLATS